MMLHLREPCASANLAGGGDKGGLSAYQTASLSFTAFAGAKVSFRAALIVMALPVAGLRPSRSGVSLGDAVLVGQPSREIEIGHVFFLLLGGKGWRTYRCWAEPSPAQFFDPEFLPHPREIVGRHQVIGINLPSAEILEMFEPCGELAAAGLAAGTLARHFIAEHRDGLIEERPILAIEHVMHERGGNLDGNVGCWLR